MLVGKDILRLITTAMYDDPLILYREYIQNAVDAIDYAVTKGFQKDKGIVSVNFNHTERTIIISDNGRGVPARKFRKRMTSIGWSEKAQTPLRGLWGIGRLAGLVYCQHLVFRTKAVGENTVSRIDWDGQKLKELMFSSNNDTVILDVIKQVTKLTTEPVDSNQQSFFEVQMNKVARHGNDVLFNESTVREYIGQIAPVPFHADTAFHDKIESFLALHVDVSGYCISLNGEQDYIKKPYRKDFDFSATKKDRFSDIELFAINSMEEKPIAIGWILHHSYLGSLKSNPAIRGVRVRCGNMQIGTERVLSSIFPEERFNSWAVGEVHILDEKVRPNGQRSNMEYTPAFRDIKNQLTSKVGRTIAKRCRMNSSARNRIRIIAEQMQSIEEGLSMIETNILSSQKAENILENMEEKIADLNFDSDSERKSASARIDKILKRIRKCKKSTNKSSCLDALPKIQQSLVNNIADLIYEHSPNSKTAEQLLRQLGSSIGNGKAHGAPSKQKE